MKSASASFKIIGLKVHNLFGYRNYSFSLNLNPKVTIIYGLNGTGKTTILKILNNVLCFNFIELEKIMFGSFHFKLENGFSIEYQKGSIKEDSKIIYYENQNKVKDIWYPFRIIKEDTRSYRYKASKMDLLNFYLYSKKSNLYRTLSQMYNLPEDEGKHRLYDFFFRTNIPYLDKFSRMDLYNILKPLFKNEEKPFPLWFGRFVKDNPVDFIKSERLVRIEKRTRDKRSYEKRIIDDYTNHLFELKRKYINRFNELSQTLYTTFPERVIRALENVKGNEIPNTFKLKEQIDKIREKEKNLISKGLLVKGHEAEPPIDTESLENDEIAIVLSLWIEDSNRKYSIFNPLLKLIELFENILNGSHLVDKVIRFDIEGGFYFYLENMEQKLKGTMLSSGEQHAVVLFYYLIFKAKMNSLVLIDEPEISFHVLWQNKFVDHIIKIGNTKNLTFILATHSPEIIYGRIDLLRKLETTEI